MNLRVYLTAYALGWSVAAPIGPVNIEIIRRGLSLGPAAAFSVGCGAVSADCIYFSLSLVATHQAGAFVRSPWGTPLAFGVAGALLLWIGWMTLRAPVRDPASGGRISAAGSAARSYLFGLAITLANPMTIAFWLSIAAKFTAEGNPGAAWLRFAGVGSGALSWVIFIVSLLALARRRVTPRFLRWVNVVSGAMLTGFGLRFWMQAFLR